MRTLLAAGLGLGLLLAGAPVAQAHPNYDYAGGCRFFVVEDPTKAPGWWSGVAVLDVVTTRQDARPAPTASFDAWCEFRLNGVSSGSPMAQASGIGAGADAQPVTMNVSALDTTVFTICTHVTVENEVHSSCTDATDATLVPGQTLPGALKAALDPVVCAALGVLSPGIGPLAVRPEGDLYVAGVLLWDCPPYGSGGPATGPVGHVRYV